MDEYDLISYIEKCYRCSFLNYLHYDLDYRKIDDMYLLERFHNIYLKLLEQSKDYEIDILKEISDKYLSIIGKLKEYNEKGKFKKLNEEVIHEPLVSRYNLSNIPFCLDELFSLDSLLKFEDKRLCGVCLITQIQTVCVYNDDKCGHIGSGLHSDSFHNIIKAAYEEEFTDEYGIKYTDTGQDIKISFFNSLMNTKDGDAQRIVVLVDVPVPIRSYQKKSLKILNEELKRYQKDNNIEIEISSSLINYYDDFFVEFDCRNNLDEVLNYAVISDDYSFEYSDKKIIGFINGENHFNDSSFIFVQRKIGR